MCMSKVRGLITFLCLMFGFSVIAQQNKATFSYFEYKGNDEFFNKKINPAKSYFNPIVSGFHPDPSICRKGDDYYLVNSSFSYYPGIPIFHSKDLVSWQQIGHVLDRPSQLKLDGLGVSSGIYAPDIKYNEKNKTFYMVTTLVGGINNFLVKTTDISKGWSEPILLPKVNGIDPSIFFDDDGKAYIVNCAAPDKELWSGHRAIRLIEYDLINDKTIGTGKIIADGGVDPSTKPVWMEGPHLYKIKGTYYLMTAEGGTGESHREVIFKCNKVNGDYTPLPINPILTQKGLPADRKDIVTCTGHADLIQTATGDWFSVFLGTRPYNNGYYNTGRETFLLPVKWVDSTPIILKAGDYIPIVVNKAGLDSKAERPTGNFVWRDEFTSDKLKLEWNMLRTPRDEWWKQEKNKMIISAMPKSIYEKVNPAFLGRRIQHQTFEVSASMKFIPTNEKELSGLALIQNEKNNLVVGKTIKDGKAFVVLYAMVQGVKSTIAETEMPANASNEAITFSVIANKGTCSFYYKIDKGDKITIAENVDTKCLSTRMAGGFVGAYVGMYATSVAQ